MKWCRFAPFVYLCSYLGWDTCETLLQINQLEEIGSKWFRVEPWKRWCASMLARITEGGLPTAEEANGESPAIEVFILSPIS